MIDTGKKNLIAGIVAMLLAMFGGLALAFTFDAFAVRGNDHVLSLVRFYLREGHSHGMPLAIFNMLIALWVDRVELSRTLKQVVSWSAICSLILPLALAMKGAAGAPSDFPPLGLPGVLGLALALSLMLAGAIRMKRG
ncbi:MAG: hypothetical protein K1X75_17735 [Leptospirales bacterium]|nr:hypothetical protein [Leptospirales bacterium]